MEITSNRIPERDNNQNQTQTPSTSPTSNGSSTITSNGSSLIPTPPHTPTPTPTPKTIFRSQEPNPYPTTFVQADTSTFKHVVQMLTGSSQTAKKTDSPPPPSRGAASTIPPIKSTAQKKQGFKLYERRNSLKNGLMINTLLPGYSQNSTFSPRKHEILSPSFLDFPALALSPHTPLRDDGASKSAAAAVEEERAIAEKKFYFHPSPRTTTPRNAEPQLLPLFPVTSPRVSESSA